MCDNTEDDLSLENVHVTRQILADLKENKDRENTLYITYPHAHM